MDSEVNVEQFQGDCAMGALANRIEPRLSNAAAPGTEVGRIAEQSIARSEMAASAIAKNRVDAI